MTHPLQYQPRVQTRPSKATIQQVIEEALGHLEVTELADAIASASLTWARAKGYPPEVVEAVGNRVSYLAHMAAREAG